MCAFLPAACPPRALHLSRDLTVASAPAELPVLTGTGMPGGGEPCLSNGIFAPNYYWCQ